MHSIATMKLLFFTVNIAIAFQDSESLTDVAKRGTKDSETVPMTNLYEPCTITVHNGMNYFHSKLLTKEPHFVQFKIKQVENEHYTVNEDVFEPFRWSWTYKESSGPYPFISWNLDYGILSFHLLEAKTIYLEQEIELNVSKGCNITYGSEETLEKLVEAFVSLINVSTDAEDFPTYPESYFCYYQIHRIDSNTPNYIISQYFIYNLGFIEYKCAEVVLNFSSKSFNVKTVCKDCIPRRHEWLKSSYFPHVFSILALLYCSPVIVFSTADWMSKYEKIIANAEEEEYEIIGDPFEFIYSESDVEEDWLYADGVSHPLTVSDVFNFHTLGLATKFPYFTGRLRRLIFVLVVPLFIYAQLLMYNQGMGMWHADDKITVKDLIDLGAPMGFLSLLGDPKNRQNAFAFWLGGPVGVTCLYFALSFLFIVLPRSLKQIIEDGLPSAKSSFKSPLFLTFHQTIRFSKVTNRYNKFRSGYAKAITVIKCRFYMLFSAPLWQYIWTTQRTRWLRMCSGRSTGMCFLKQLSFPLYLAGCLVEIICCLIYYGIPFSSFITIVVKGATRSLGYLKQQNRILRVVFSFRISIMFVFVVYTLYTYIISIVFVKSLLFVCQVLTYCFVAVILYPSVAFGYLFFFTVILYYFIKLIQIFSDDYMELLTTAVDLSRHIDAKTDYVYYNGGHLNILNLRINHIKDIKVNGKLLDVSQDILRSLETVDVWKVREKNGVYGIPKALFDMIVKEFRPVHRQLLSLSFKAAVIMVFVAALFSLSASCVSGPTSEISEVMHVMFIVVVGALPRLISSVMSHSNTMLVKEIEERQMKAIIIHYWKGCDHGMA